LVRNVFPDDVAVVMTVPPAAPDAAALLAALAGAAALLLLPLEHAATSSAAPTAPPTPAASLARPDTVFVMETRISVVSRLTRPSPRLSRSSVTLIRDLVSNPH
jgi:hypothetical protein